MLLWFASLFFLLAGLRTLASTMSTAVPGVHRELKALAQVTSTFSELQETLEAGSLPEPERWNRLLSLPEPWGRLSSESVRALRSQGAALVPTLRRLRELAFEHARALGEAKARSAQALAQAWVSAGITPLLAGILYWLLPALRDRAGAWLAASVLAFTLALAGAYWLYEMAEDARWGGLAREKRGWLLAALCSGERLFASIRAGTPADLAWAGAHEDLARNVPGLASLWCASLWGQSPPRPKPAAENLLADRGNALRLGLQSSLVEGRPCLERAESELAALRRDFRSLVETELGLLATRAMKPLFLFISPSIFSLIALAIWLSFQEAWL